MAFIVMTYTAASEDRKGSCSVFCVKSGLLHSVEKLLSLRDGSVICFAAVVLSAIVGLMQVNGRSLSSLPCPTGTEPGVGGLGL